MSSPSKDNPQFARITSILKELGKDDLLDVFIKNDLTVSFRLFDDIVNTVRDMFKTV